MYWPITWKSSGEGTEPVYADLDHSNKISIVTSRLKVTQAVLLSSVCGNKNDEILTTGTNSFEQTHASIWDVFLKVSRSLNSPCSISVPFLSSGSGQVGKQPVPAYLHLQLQNLQNSLNNFL
jgi:hypothetical protein